MQMEKLSVVKKETIKRWDFLNTFKPPQKLSIESGQIFSIEKLLPTSADYQFVA